MPCHKISKLETRKEASKWHNYLNYEGRAQDDDDDVDEATRVPRVANEIKCKST